METVKMGFVEAVKTCLSKSIVFKGRARRSEYWWWVLFSCIVSMAMSIGDKLIPDTNMLLVALYVLFAVGVGIYLGIANMAVTTRRLHDIGRSGWWYGASLLYNVAFTIWIMIRIFGVAAGMDANSFANTDAMGDALLKDMLGEIIIGFIPYVIYSIVLLVWYCKDSQPGTNKYGDNPKEVASLNSL